MFWSLINIFISFLILWKTLIKKKKKTIDQVLQLFAIIHDKNTTSLPTPKFHIRKKKKKKRRQSYNIQEHIWCVHLTKIIFVSLFLLLFMGPTVLLGTIHESYYTISANYYLYLQHFQQKVFNFSKISRSQMDPI